MRVFDARLFLAFLIKPKASSPPTAGIVAPPGMLKGTVASDTWLPPKIGAV